MEYACYSAGKETGSDCENSSDNRIYPVYDKYGACTSAECKAAVNRKVGYIKKLVCNIYAQSHNTPEYSLSRSAQERC